MLFSCLLLFRKCNKCTVVKWALFYHTIMPSNIIILHILVIIYECLHSYDGLGWVLNLLWDNILANMQENIWQCAGPQYTWVFGKPYTEILGAMPKNCSISSTEPFSGLLGSTWTEYSWSALRYFQMLLCQENLLVLIGPWANQSIWLAHGLLLRELKE